MRTKKRTWLAVATLSAVSLSTCLPTYAAPLNEADMSSRQAAQADAGHPTLAQVDESTPVHEQAKAEVKEDTDRLVVKFKDHADEPDQKEAIEQADKATDALEDAKEVKTTGTGEKVIESKDEMNPKEQKEAIEKLEADPDVESAEPDRIIVNATAAFPDSPSDSYWNAQWNMRDINVSGAWRQSTGRGVTIGVSDTGITNHPDLNQKMVSGYDFVTGSYDRDGQYGRDSNPTDPGTLNSLANWHGTHVAGIAAAKTNNGTGVAGVAPDAKISMARSLGTGAVGYESDIADSLVWLSGGTVPGVPRNPNPSGVINLSEAWPSNTCPASMKNAINSAYSRNVPVVVAAGNSGTNANYTTPANCLGAIVVGATTTNNIIVGYSNWGPMLDVMAPGGAVGAGQVFSTWNNGWYSQGSATYKNMNGTSMAAPHVAGVIALMKQKNPNLSIEQIRGILQSTGTNISGYKKVNAARAVAATPAAKPTYSLGGNIGRYYYANGGAGKFGAPTGNEKNTGEPGRVQNFSKGYGIYWSQATGAHAVNWKGDIGATYRKNRWEYGWGMPRTDEHRSTGGSAYQFFRKSNGEDYLAMWTQRNGTHVIYTPGGIGHKWIQLGREHTTGVPDNNEVRVKDGAYQFFRSVNDGKWRSSLMMWTPQHGAHLIKEYGAIGHAWAVNGREHGTYGWPVTDEYKVGKDLVRQDFSKNWTVEYNLSTGQTRAFHTR